MQIKICPKETEQLSHRPILQQTSFWANLKEKQGFETLAFEINVKSGQEFLINDTGSDFDLLVVLRQAGPDACLAYIPYGPVMQPREDYQGQFLEELSELLRPYLPDNCRFIRFDLLWQSPWAAEEDFYTEDNQWLGPPDPAIQEIRMNYITENMKLRKAPTDILPSNTIILNLLRNEEMILSMMKPKTRYNIRLSKRKGVAVREINPDELEVWYALYSETSRRNGIRLHARDYFSTLLEANREIPDRITRIQFLVAEFENLPLAAMMLSFCNGRATYLYGASSSQHRNLMGTYALQWEAICRAKRVGCREYDLFGIAPNAQPSHPMHGLYQFKIGFGGKQFHRLGCWDYPLNHLDWYDSFRAIELRSEGYYIN